MLSAPIPPVTVIFVPLQDEEADPSISCTISSVIVCCVVVWSGFIITMNYVDIPMVKKSGNSDITFVASVFTGALATFGLTTGKNGGTKGPVNCPMNKKIDKPKV